MQCILTLQTAVALLMLHGCALQTWLARERSLCTKLPLRPGEVRGILEGTRCC